MKLDNILRKARIKLATTALGVGSIFSTGCDYEKLFGILQNNVGLDSIVYLAEKEYDSARRIGPLVVTADRTLPRVTVGVIGPYDTGLSFRVGRDDNNPAGFHIDAVVSRGEKEYGLHHVRPQDYVRRGIGAIRNFRGSTIPLLVPLPPAITYPLYQEELTRQGRL